MPPGWEGKQPDTTNCLVDTDKFQTCSSSEDEPMFYPNLCFPNKFTMAQAMDVGGRWRDFTSWSRRNVDGAVDPVGLDHIRSHQFGSSANLVNIPSYRGFAAKGVELQGVQCLNRRLTGEKNKEHVKEDLLSEVREEVNKEGPTVLFPKALRQEVITPNTVPDVQKQDNKSSKPEWWAQEQLDNVVHFAQIQTDLQMLRHEVKAYWEGKEEIGPNVEWADKAEGSHKPPLMDHHNISTAYVLGSRNEVIRGSQAPGAGPFHGLDIKDDHSPKTNPSNSGLNCDQRELNSVGGINQFQSESSEYSVAFPPDDDEDKQLTRCSIGVEEEHQLVISVSRSLSLKRPRAKQAGEEEEGNSSLLLERGRMRKFRKKVDGSKARMNHDVEESGEDTIMAEEACLSMPPTQP